jgi:curved DNA-binding protein CbpA
MTPDHYEVLGVDPGSRHTDIRAAYRELMRAHHPDLRPGDPDAEEMSRRITAAWSVLSRPTKRAAYDRTRSAARQQAGLPPRVATDLPPAYSSEGSAYRRAFHAASVKIATAVFLLGVVVLLGLAR